MNGIRDALPVQRGNVRLSNLQVLNAIKFEKLNVLFLAFLNFALNVEALR